LTICGLLSASTLLSAQLQFRATTDIVTVDVSVRDRSRVVTGLTAADFEVSDNGVRQTVVDVSYGKLPVDITIALDISLSVEGERLAQLRRAVGQLMGDLGADDRLSLIAFNVRPTRIVDFTRDVAEVDRAIAALAAGGGTSIWDATAVSLSAPHPPGRRHLLVLFTDGQDTTSFTSPEQLMPLAQRMNTTISSVVPQRIRFLVRSDTGIGAQILRRLAADTGGTSIPMTSARQNLTEAFERLLDSFRSTYVLHFQPQGVAQTGFHTLEVAVVGKPDYTVVARRGYVR
jgi:VWFA-related protein